MAGGFRQRLGGILRREHEMRRSARFSISRVRRWLNAVCTSHRLFPWIKRIPFFAFAWRVKAAGTEIEEESFRLRNVYRVQKRNRVPEERYIVCADINDLLSGLGCGLFALAPCWKYALETGRTLIIDWRGNPYTRADPDRNLFSVLFESPDPSEIGVSCISDDSVNDLRVPQPILGPAGEVVQESGAVDELPNGGLDLTTMRKVLASCVDVDPPTVMPPLAAILTVAIKYGPRGTHGPPVIRFSEAERLYRSLKPRPEWAELVSEFHEAHMARGPVVGVHVRHGNGEGRYRNHFRSRVIQDFVTFLDTLADKIRRHARERLWDRYTVFLCTDSDEVVSAMETRFDSLVSRHIWRPAPGEGIDFDHAFKRSDRGVGAAGDALVDMQLLAKCDAVLISRPTTFASHVPYILEKPGAVFFDGKQTATM